MKKLLDIGNRYAKESTWKDFALVKFCLFSMGLAAGTQVSDKHRKKVIGAAACVFASECLPRVQGRGRRGLRQGFVRVRSAE